MPCCRTVIAAIMLWCLVLSTACLDNGTLRWTPYTKAAETAAESSDPQAQPAFAETAAAEPAIIFPTDMPPAVPWRPTASVASELPAFEAPPNLQAVKVPNWKPAPAAVLRAPAPQPPPDTALSLTPGPAMALSHRLAFFRQPANADNPPEPLADDETTAAPEPLPVPVAPEPVEENPRPRPAPVDKLSLEPVPAPSTPVEALAAPAEPAIASGAPAEAPPPIIPAASLPETAPAAQSAAPKAKAAMAGQRDFTIDTRKPAQAIPADARDLDAVKRRGVLVVAQQNSDNPPFFFVDGATGELRGFDVDLAVDLARALGVRLVVNRSFEAFQHCADAVEAGLVDIAVTNLSATEKRKEHIDFSEPYIIGYLALLADFAELDRRLPGVEIIGPSDLDRPEVVIGVEKGSSYEGDLRDLFPKATPYYEIYNDDSDRTAAIREKKAQAFLRDEISLAGLIAGNPGVITANGGAYTLVLLYSTQDPIAVGIAKTAPRLRAFIDDFLDNLPDVPTASSLVRRYSHP